MHNIKNWLAALLAGLLLAVGLGVSAPAQAWTGGSASGSMNYGEYAAVWHHESLADVNYNCGCTGVVHRVTSDSPYEWVVYTANNNSFAWNICHTVVWFANFQGLGWIAYGTVKDSDPDYHAKAREDCNGTYYYDNLAPAPTPV